MATNLTSPVTPPTAQITVTSPQNSTLGFLRPQSRVLLRATDMALQLSQRERKLLSHLSPEFRQQLNALTTPGAVTRINENTLIGILDQIGISYHFRTAYRPADPSSGYRHKDLLVLASTAQKLIELFIHSSNTLFIGIRPVDSCSESARQGQKSTPEQVKDILEHGVTNKAGSLGSLTAFARVARGDAEAYVCFNGDLGGGLVHDTDRGLVLELDQSKITYSILPGITDVITHEPGRSTYPHHTHTLATQFGVVVADRLPPDAIRAIYEYTPKEGYKEIYRAKPQ